MPYMTNTVERRRLHEDIPQARKFKNVGVDFEEKFPPPKEFEDSSSDYSRFTICGPQDDLLKRMPQQPPTPNLSNSPGQLQPRLSKVPFRRSNPAHYAPGGSQAQHLSQFTHPSAHPSAQHSDVYSSSAHHSYGYPSAQHSDVYSSSAHHSYGYPSFAHRSAQHSSAYPSSTQHPSAYPSSSAIMPFDALAYRKKIASLPQYMASPTLMSEVTWQHSPNGLVVVNCKDQKPFVGIVVGTMLPYKLNCGQYQLYLSRPPESTLAADYDMALDNLETIQNKAGDHKNMISVHPTGELARTVTHVFERRDKVDKVLAGALIEMHFTIQYWSIENYDSFQAKIEYVKILRRTT